MKRQRKDADTKLAAVLEGLRGESAIADTCQKYKIGEQCRKRQQTAPGPCLPSEAKSPAPHDEHRVYAAPATALARRRLWSGKKLGDFVNMYIQHFLF